MIAVPVIAIFDIGKTNKKFFLLDENYQIVLERSVQFEEIADEDGDACDDIQLLSGWVTKTLTEILQQQQFEIKAVNFSAYGASLVYINESGGVIAPLYNYLKSYPEEIKNALYEKYGGAEQISCETASPVLGSLNSGMQLYRMKIEKPELYGQVKYALHLPQYLSFLISQKAYSDITSIGCHTQLWDYQKNNYHDWVIAEELAKKLAPLHASDNTDTVLFQQKELEVGIGLHDSSAALIPYLAVFKEPFILISTGTWCISLNPFNNTPLTTAELNKDCLCYMEYKGKPVKASRLFAGNEHEQQTKILAQHFNKPADYYKEIRYNSTTVQQLQKKYSFDVPVKKNEDYIYASVFQTRKLEAFKDYEEAYHCLLLDIMLQQYNSTKLVLSGSAVSRIFVDGGFSNNSIYMHLLALAFPRLEVYAASVAQATAMGAALAIHREWNTQPVPADMVKLKYYKAADVAVADK
jgi:sugar (pentulose or hexulose) kinase